MAEVNLTLGDPIEVKVAPAEGATNVTVNPAPLNIVQVQAAIATNGLAGADGAGVPSDPAGKEGQALVKSSDVAQETEWAYIEKLHITVKNETGSTIPEGSAVYAAGISGNNILVALADASSANTMPAIGITNEEITNNSSGDVISSGVITKTLTGFSGLSVGDTVYVSETAGEVTTTKPSGTALIQNIGVVLKTNGTNIQKMKVSSIDRVNDIPNLASGKIFLGGATNQISPYTLPTTSPAFGEILVGDSNGDLVYQSQTGYKANLATADLVANSVNRTYNVFEDGNLIFRDEQDDPIVVIGERDKTLNVYGLLTAEANLHVGGNITVDGTVDGKDVSTLLANVIEDTSPQLGGPLDLNSQGITDSTGIDLNNNVFIPTSALHIGATTSPDASLHITGGSVKIDDGVNPYILPFTDGSANQVIKTNGSGAASFGSLSIDNLSDVDTTTAAPTDGQALLWDNTAQQWEPGTVSTTSENLGNTDLTLSAERDLDLNGNALIVKNGSTETHRFFNNGYFKATGRIIGAGSATGGAVLRLNEGTNNGFNYVDLRAPADISTSISYTLPDSVGVDGAVLTSDTDGLMTFTKPQDAKVYHTITCGFYDDIGTINHFLPLNGPPSEQTTNNNSYTGWLCPTGGQVEKVLMKLPTNVTAGTTLTFRTYKAAVGANPASESVLEGVSITIADTDDNHVVEIPFTATSSFNAAEMLFVSVASSVDMSGFANMYCQVITILDWNTRLKGTTPTIHD